MTVIIVGAGFVGQHLLGPLIRRGEQVRCTVRNPEVGKLVAKAGAEPIFADIRDVDSLITAFRGSRVIINLSTCIFERARGDFARFHLLGMRNIVHAAEVNGITRVLHIGALGSEADRLNPERSYLYWKEQASSYLQSSNLDYTIFETSIVYGSGDQHLSSIALTLKALPFFPFPGARAAKTLFQPLYVGDLVTGLMKALDDSRSTRCTYSFGGRQVFQYRELVQIVSSLLDIRKKIVFVPIWAYYPVLKQIERRMHKPPLSTSLLDLIGVDSIADSRLTYNHFGIQPVDLLYKIGYLRLVGRREFNAWRTGLPVDWPH